MKILLYDLHVCLEALQRVKCPGLPHLCLVLCFLNVRQYVSLRFDLFGEASESLGVEGDQLHLVCGLQLGPDGGLVLPQVLGTSLDQAYAPFDVRLPSEAHIVYSLQHFSLALVHPLAELLEVAGDLELQVSRLVRQVSLPGLQFVLLELQVLALLACHVQKTLEILEKLRVSAPDRLHLVALVLSMDYALGADRRALAREAVVADELIRVRRARRATSRQL